MKELEKLNADQTEVRANAQQQKQQKLLGRIKKHNGHKLWKINNETLEITEAETSNKNFVVGEHNNSKVTIEKGFTYISCLNKKNALNKYIRAEIERSIATSNKK